MIYVAITVKGDSLSGDSPVHSSTVKDMTEREKKEYSSGVSRMALLHLYKKVYGTDMPSIVKDEMGRPYLDGKGCPDISISDSCDLCAVAICTKGKIGIDIQTQKNCIKEEKISERFFKNVNFGLLKEIKEPLSIFFFRLQGNGKIIECEGVPMMLSETQSNQDTAGRVDFSLSMTDIRDHSIMNFYTKWTLLEASLKAQGEGFRALNKADEYMHSSLLASYEIFIHGCAYSLSICETN